MIGDKVITAIARAQKRQARERRALELERERQHAAMNAITERQARERELRELWDAQGVSVERQDQLLSEIEAKAQPGAMVGPFVIPHDTQ